MLNRAVSLGLSVVVCGAAIAWAPDVHPPTCVNVAARLTQDYSYLIGSADFRDGDMQSGSTFRWLVNSHAVAEGAVSELLSLHLNNSVAGRSGELPAQAEGVTYGAGRWGSALALQPHGHLSFERDGNLDLSQGTIEMWVAMRGDGDAPVYSGQWHVLLYYEAPNGDSIAIAQADDTGILYAGGMAGGQWQSAYGSLASTRSWQAGEWHHLAYSYSASGGFMRFYVDGVLTADTNEGHYWPPSDGGSHFFIGGAEWGDVAHYVIDELRISGHMATAEEIAARARRQSSPRANEVWLSTDQLVSGDAVAFEFTPADAFETGSPCVSDPLAYPGIPLTNPRPPSTLLPPHTTEFTLAVQSAENTSCAYAVGESLAFDEMTPFDTGTGTTIHETVIQGLDADPNVVNDVYVRCAAHPDFGLHLQYRSLSQTNPSYPRTGNLWGSWEIREKGLPYCARIDLWLGGSFGPDEIRQLRGLNPDIVVLTSINAVENSGLSDDYYLKDIHGDPVEVWPGSYRLNLTKPYVAEYQARYAYQRVLDSDLMVDGVFFDNVMTTQSWQTEDIYGDPFLVDADEDGVVDDPAVFDAAWKAGVFHEMEVFRELMPHAIVSGHAMDIYEPGIADIFNGIGIGFATTDVIENKLGFAELWEYYCAWHDWAVRPTVTMVESAPPDQISYGYDYEPWDKVPPSTLEFARTYYPYVRFGLAFVMMNDGYFAHEFGDTWHGNDWWYDELDFDLGYPLGPAERVDLGIAPGENIVENGDFEDPIGFPWSFWVNTDAGCAATVSRDTTDAAEGLASARIDVSATSGEAWHIEFAQRDRSLTEGTAYDVVFWAKSDVPRSITLSAQKGSPNWRGYGLWRCVPISTEWEKYSLSFEANETVDDSRIQFMVGEMTGTVWLDDVQVYERGPDVYQREFTNGLVLLNASREPQTIDVGTGYWRLTGSQAPQYEYIVDDSDTVFSTTGNWAEVTYDSGEWQAEGPFYHNWGDACHESSGASCEARWDLWVPEEDTYTITAWWPAAPSSDTWTESVTYEVVAGGQVVASAVLDQRSGGDEWHFVGQASLVPDDGAFVRLTCPGSAPCIADALHIRSRARYNDGSPTSEVTLQPKDGIVLSRFPEYSTYLPLVSSQE